MQGHRLISSGKGQCVGDDLETMTGVKIAMHLEDAPDMGRTEEERFFRVLIVVKNSLDPQCQGEGGGAPGKVSARQHGISPCRAGGRIREGSTHLLPDRPHLPSGRPPCRVGQVGEGQRPCS